MLEREPDDTALRMVLFGNSDDKGCAYLPNIPAAYAIGFTSGWGDAANVVKCGVMSGAENLMKAPLFPICQHDARS